jgi:hypothetical protein
MRCPRTWNASDYRLRLSGRPDYLIETTEGLVPVELKSGACPALDRMPLMWRS